MSRIIVFDPASGASGDMILGALIDVGAPLSAMQEAVSRLGIAGVRIRGEAASSAREGDQGLDAAHCVQGSGRAGGRETAPRAPACTVKRV